MKRGLILIAFFLVVSVLLISFVSAGWFSDNWNKITGKVASGSQNNITGIYCHDSDGGDDSYVKGSVLVVYKSWFGLITNNYTFTDSCYSTLVKVNNTYVPQKGLVEYYCDNTNLKSKQYICTCVDGACVAPCTDSDGGKNYYVKGGVNKGASWFEDRCEPDGLLKEYYCQSPTEEGFERYACPKGCFYGECLNVTVRQLGEKAYYKEYLNVDGKIVQVSQITNNIVGFDTDQVTFTDASGNIYPISITKEGEGTVPIGGIAYVVKYYGNSTQPPGTRYVIVTKLAQNPNDGCGLLSSNATAKVIELQNLVSNYTNYTNPYANRSVGFVVLKEGEKIYTNDYAVIPSYPYVIKIIRIINNSNIRLPNTVTWQNIFNGDVATVSDTVYGNGELLTGGSKYTFVVYASPPTNPSDSRSITLDFPQTTGTIKMTFYCQGFVK